MEVTFNYTKYLDKNPLQKFLIENFFNALFSITENLKIKRILDAGCGEGILLEKLRKRKIGKHFEGIDNSRAALKIAKKLHPNLILKHGGIERLPYKENSFDLVLCIEVLEHLRNPAKAFLELRRVTKKYFVASVPNEPIFRIANFLRGRYVREFGNTPGYINHWSKNGFINFVKEQKINIVSVKTPFPWTVVLGEK